MHYENDIKLVEACLHNDRTAQKRLYEQYAPQMMAVASRYVGDYEQAQDVLQEAFIKIFTSLDCYQGKGALEHWVRRIVVNVALEMLRRNNVLDDCVSCEEAIYVPTNEETIVDRMSADELIAIISSLPVGYRTVFNMYAIEGYSHKEIAQHLGINEASSRSQYNRARAMIQKKIGQID